ncbi:multidrug transporter [uncultured Microbacterium sp.]|uniref:multidrug transporter n=1 Tax=uncultured Microbacterium sp. TaxID=191216 RepID=UPI002613FC54|nr:multidrug transporter [uncultured Microbacterium sp.]
MTSTEQTPEEKRRDQLTAAPAATEADAAPRIEVTRSGTATRVDIRNDATVRPGPGPGMPEADAGQDLSAPDAESS